MLQNASNANGGRRQGWRAGAFPRARVAAVARSGAGIRVLQEAPAVPIVSPEGTGSEDVAYEPAFLPASDAQIWL